jgi:hypothetical protein
MAYRRGKVDRTGWDAAMQPSPAFALSPADIQRYRVQGFLAVPEGVVPADELPLIRGIYDRLFAERAGKAEGKHFALFGDEQKPDQPIVPQILAPDKLAPELTRTRAWANARSVLTALLGAEPENQGGHAILKPPHSPLATPWHQDEAYWDTGLWHISVSLWIPLQDVDERSGCMQFIPGSHLGDILPHRPAGDDPRAQGLELEPGAWDLGNAVACPLRAGGCTAHPGRTLHYTGPNQAEVPRRAWIVGGGISVPERRIRAHYPWLERMWAARAAARASAAQPDRLR